MAQTEPFLVLDRPMRRAISLPSKSDAEAFLDREEKLWAWIDDTANHTSNEINGISNQYRSQTWLSSFRNVLNQRPTDFEQLMRKRYRDDQCLCSLDPEATAVQVLADTDKIVAAVALATIHGALPANNQNFLRSDIRNRIGQAHANALLAGIDPSIVVGSNRFLMEGRETIELDAQRVRAISIVRPPTAAGAQPKK